MGLMFEKTRDQMTDSRWDNPSNFGNQVNRSNPQTTNLGGVKRTGKYFSWHSSNDLVVKIELPSCRKYIQGNFLAIGLLNWDEIIDEDDDDEN